MAYLRQSMAVQLRKTLHGNEDIATMTPRMMEQKISTLIFFILLAISQKMVFGMIFASKILTLETMSKISFLFSSSLHCTKSKLPVENID